MYEVKFKGLSFLFSTLEQSLTVAIGAVAQGVEVDVISSLTGEIIFYYQGEQEVYVASCIKMVV